MIRSPAFGVARAKDAKLATARVLAGIVTPANHEHAGTRAARAKKNILP